MIFRESTFGSNNTRFSVGDLSTSTGIHVLLYGSVADASSNSERLKEGKVGIFLNVRVSPYNGVNSLVFSEDSVFIEEPSKPQIAPIIKRWEKVLTKAQLKNFYFGTIAGAVAPGEIEKTEPYSYVVEKVRFLKVIEDVDEFVIASFFDPNEGSMMQVTCPKDLLTTVFGSPKELQHRSGQEFSLLLSVIDVSTEPELLLWELFLHNNESP